MCYFLFLCTKLPGTKFDVDSFMFADVRRKKQNDGLIFCRRHQNLRNFLNEAECRI